MPIKITIADEPELIDEVFKIRHEVFVEEENLLEGNEQKRLYDVFDAMPTTKNLVVIDEGSVIGSFRMTSDSKVGLPADDYYDFRRHLPKDAKIMHTGMLCVKRDYRNPRVTSDLMLMSSYYAKSHGITHVVAPINPKIAKLLMRIGFVQIGEEFIEPELNAPMLPLILDVENLNDFFINFVQKNELQDFLGDYERFFYKKGEQIIKAGDEGKYAFLVISGFATVYLPNSEHKIGEIHEGELFGELALLTDELRSADIFASTDVQVMTLSKPIFTKYFYNKPEQVQRLLKLMGKRTQTLIGELERMQL